MASKKKKNDSKPAAAPKAPKPTANGKPEELCYTSAQYPVKELYQALLSRISALTNAGYECLWHPIDLSGEKELLVPHHVSRVDDRTLKAWPLIVSEKKTGGVPALQLGMEIDMLENVAVLKGIGRIPRDENRYETVHAILSQFKAVTGIELTVEARG